MKPDPRLLSPQQLAQMRAGMIPDGVTAVEGLLRHVEQLLGHIDALTEQQLEDRAVIALAENLIAAKRQGDLAFAPLGIRSAADLIDSDAYYRRIAQEVRDAGNALARAIDERQGRTS